MHFAEISDSDQALKMLREIKQYRDENVQWYAERLLFLASEAYNNQPGGVQAADGTLVGHFTDGLYFDYLQFKMLREKPQTLQEAVRICIEEQNLRNYLEQGLVGIMGGKIQVILGLMNQWRSICIGHPVNVNFVLKMAILQGTVKVKEINAVNMERNDRDRHCYFCGKPGHTNGSVLNINVKIKPKKQEI